VTGLLIAAAIFDAALLAALALRFARSRARGMSLRLRLFFALTGAMLLGAFATGVYATLVDAATLGFSARFARVAPKGFVLASALLPVLGAAAAWVGGRLARPVEELSEAAAQIAEGASVSNVRSGHGAEAQKLARALTSMRRELADRPYAAAFLRDAWHDLKTPVAAISATLEVLEDGALEDPDRSQARRFLANLRRSTDQLDRRLSDLVTLARFETSAVAASELVDVDDLVRGAVEGVLALAVARNVTLSSVGPGVLGGGAGTQVRCDEAALTRGLSNVLENAINASPGGSLVVRWDDAARDRIVIDVSNEPSTIPEGVRARLFERAVTGDAEHGSGLGLAITRAAIEAHGGTVRFTEMGPPRVTVRIDLPR